MIVFRIYLFQLIELLDRSDSLRLAGVFAAIVRDLYARPSVDRCQFDDHVECFTLLCAVTRRLGEVICERCPNAKRAYNPIIDECIPDLR